MLAFAADAAVLSHIQHWIADLDKPGQVDPARNIFIYLVQNTTAASLGATVQAVLCGGQPGGESATPEIRLEQASRTQPPGFGQSAPIASNNKLSVLSTPRVLAKSGGQAKIEVGTEVPIITSQGSTNTIQNAGTTGILQSIEYRKTGVLLTVQPVVHSSDRIDLTVSQEVSQALPNSTPGISSPLIQNRNVSTQVALADGQTVVIGGLISEDRTNADSGVPYLKDIPGIGTIFRNQSSLKEKTELLVFITPYIVTDDADSERITEQFRDRMQRWPVPSGELRW
jgi:Flp pilus assembly secretin CpaC